MSSETKQNVREKVSLLPSDPGVYQFINESGEVIYVGKAKNLKRRVSSYFIQRHDDNRKLRVLVSKIVDLRHIVVATEADALLLENNLIKTLKPRYNILLKDDKTYPWICIKNEPFPRIISTRRMVRDGSRYFGPYSSVMVQKYMIELIRSIYTLRTCSLNLAPSKIAQGRYSVCLEYHIGNCLGPCIGAQTEEEYAKNIISATDVLKGNTSEAVEYLNSEMADAATQLKFETAQKFKEKIDLVRNFHTKSVIVSNMLTDLDVFSLVTDEGVGYCNFTRVKAGAIINSFTVELKLGVDDTPEDILTFSILSIEERIEGGLSHEIIVPFMPDTSLFERKNFIVPQRGEKVELLKLSERNCRLYRLEQLKNSEKKDPHKRVDRVMAAMRSDLYMDVEPRHIECFDNSNIGGAYPVAACVVFRDGKPAKRDYRHYNIKTVIGANDFASMAEVVGRRYSRLLEEGAELPQLIVIDGGKGQLSFAYNIIQSMGLADKIKIVGLAKRYEEIYFPNESESHFLDKSSETLKVLMHIRDEAHRFGITFHRNKRSNDFVKSELDSIKGLGSKSVEALMKRFKGISGVRSASLEELTEVVGKSRAEIVKQYFS